VEGHNPGVICGVLRLCRIPMGVPWDLFRNMASNWLLWVRHNLAHGSSNTRKLLRVVVEPKPRNFRVLCQAGRPSVIRYRVGTTLNKIYATCKLHPNEYILLFIDSRVSIASFKLTVTCCSLTFYRWDSICHVFTIHSLCDSRLNFNEHSQPKYDVLIL
jgi:hypothetical protein